MPKKSACKNCKSMIFNLQLTQVSYKYLKNREQRNHSQRDINVQNSRFRSNSSISNFSKNKIQKFWRKKRRYKFRDIIKYQILQHFQSDFHTFITFHVSFRL